MTSQQAVNCGVIGNPIAHSQSPGIHLNFAKQLSINLNYQKYLVEPENLNTFVNHFFENNGKGLNVTAPFKNAVFKIAKNISVESKKCQSVNTLYLNSKNEICGDTTDGKGLLIDLQSKQFDVKNKNILIVGSGGATTSILYALLMEGAKITLHNRTASKIETIKNNFSDISDNITIFKEGSSTQFDGVITATSKFNPSILNPILNNIHINTFVYDLNYKERATETLNYFKENGVSKRSDGYGMLIAQAAVSFKIWHDVMPGMDL